MKHNLFFETFSDHAGEHDHRILHKLEEFMPLKRGTKYKAILKFITLFLLLKWTH